MTVSPPQAPVTPQTAYYTSLQAQVDAHLDALGRILENSRPRIEEDLLVVRGLAAQVRTLLERVARYERILEAVDDILEPQAETHPVEGLRGKAIGNTALEVLRQTGIKGAIHSRRWFQLFEQAGHRAGGQDAYASFLTALTRHPDIEQVGNRSGLYRLRDDT